MTTPTIYALSSGRGRAAIALVRMSGPAAAAAAAALGAQNLTPRRATCVRLADPETGEHLDDAVALYFPAPASVTGDDVVELHLHGGAAVIAAVLSALAMDADVRMAEPGEFTRRAFENGKMDLTGAEAIADLIDAETATQRRQALRQGGGALAEQCEAWRCCLMAAQSRWEALIDFSGEDLPAGLEARVSAEVSALGAGIQAHLDDNRRGERLRDGVRVAIIGPPNAGKSSFINILAKREAAIVAATAGTTRDVVEVHLDLGGYAVIAADTAGLRPTTDPVEREGVRRAQAQARDADVRLALFTVGDWPPDPALYADRPGAETIFVINKIDQTPPPASMHSAADFLVSVKTGAGIEALLAALETRVRGGFEETREPPLITRQRHREALQACADALAAFLARSDRQRVPEIAAEDLRYAAHALGRITGRVDVEDLLDEIFQAFCIGK